MFCIIKRQKVISIYRNLYKTKLIKEIMEENNEHPESTVNNNLVEHHSKKHSSGNWIWIAATIILAILLILVLFTGFSFTGQVTKISAESKLTAFANSVGADIKVNNIEPLGDNLYSVNASINGEDGQLYLTKDGNYLVMYVSPLTIAKTASAEEEVETEIIKSDKPIVELFVMTHCPYGTQAEKGFIPAIKNLGSTIDANIRFVHYFMHGDKEEQETYNQVCIREEQSAKYLDYLTCFLEDGNSTRCLTKIGIDKKKLNNCLANNYTKAKEYYAFDSQLSESYGVQGSPTLVINGVQISSGRDAASMLDAICTTFSDESVPEFCGASLSTASPSSGFGTGTASSASSAQC